MINAYQEIVSFNEDDFNGFLMKRHLFAIFSPLLDLDFVDRVTFKGLVRYVAATYSLESDQVILGMDWQKNKRQIYDKEELPDTIWDQIGMLKNKVFRDTVSRWLDLIENDSLTQLKYLKDLRVEMQTSCVAPILNASLQINYDQKFKNAEYSIQLKTMIKDLESELIQNNVRLKEAVKEVKSASRVKYTVGPENFSK